ncbi:MAG: tetrahydromethanopterin S-methyltransferase subunit A [Crenarchaeota archaeon]|nr:tetrahydromethanopterin S-methyltransferase subunit A [Thermoproteota archaeon]HJJ21312.1 tetrahydromethanopterin S-methyltransferase subunit A [Nitrosopumilus sp.]MDA0853363.1 tetrahydromethanopterin S-methyltransferase subunit A [Thermoproteota archaeon]MDA1123013.1 tetrahydromethanopterin S-methyltransferase subunit A [Thermoproteota archaeon]HJJ24753.1 tetrahydromethanopterin S-methyltransferase subunit A [Nitrosopumilus sp.]
MNKLNETIGKICEVLLPITEEFYIGNSNSSICICTLSSIKLLKEIKNSEIIDKVAIVGRLFTENKGIDSIIKHVNQNKKIKIIIVCGKEVWGHKSGHSLFELHKNGVDNNNRIINSTSPNPFLTVSELEIKYFQKEITLVNLINETNMELIINKISIN